MIYSNSKRIGFKNYEEYIEKMYDIDKYNSFSSEKQSLKKRIDKLYSQYLRNKELTPTDFYEENGFLKDYWNKTCVTNMRKINTIISRLEILEKSIQYSLTDDEEALCYFENIITKKEYHEKLRTMSNFYSKFLPEETYNFLKMTTD